MADNTRMTIRIEADSKQATQAFRATDTQLDAMSQHAVRVAQSIAQHFQTMAREIEMAIRGLNGAFSGLDNGTRRLVDQFGRPIVTSNGPAPAVPGVSGGAFAGAAAAGSRNNPMFQAYNAARQAEDAGAPEFQKRKQDFVRQFYSRLDTLLRKTDDDLRKMASSPESFRAVHDFQEYMRRYANFVQHRDIAITKGDQSAAAGFDAQAAEAMKRAGIASGTWRKLEDEAQAAAGANKKLGESASDVGEGFGTSMFKAVMWYEALEKGILVTKTLTIETAKFAAETQMYGIAMTAVAKANGVAADSAERMANVIKSAGISGQTSKRVTAQAIAAGIDLNTLPQLADLSKNLAVMKPGMTSSDVLTNLIYAIQTGQPEMLRTIGMNVNFDLGYRREARRQGLPGGAEALTEWEKMGVRVAAVLKEAPRYAGMYEQSMGGVGKQMKSLPRLFDDAKDAIGNNFIPAMQLVVTTAAWALDIIQKHPAVAKAAAVTGGGLAGVGTGAVVGGLIGSGIGALGFGAGAVPGGIFGAKIGAAVGGAAGLGLSGWSAYQPDQQSEQAKQQAQAKAQQDKSAADKRAKEIADQREREKRELEQMRRDDARRETLKSARRSASDAVQDALSQGYEGVKAIRAKYQKAIKDRLTYIDPVTQQPVQFQDAQVTAQFRRAAAIEIEATKRKMVRDLEREITREQANQLEGWDKTVKLNDLEIERLKEQGFDTQKLVSLQNTLTQMRQQTLVKETEWAARDNTERALAEEQQGYSRITAELELQIRQIDRKNALSAATIDLLNQQAAIQRRILDRQNQDEIDRMRQDIRRGSMNAGLEALGEEEQTRLAGLEHVYTWDLRSKLSVEQQKYEIESHYLDLIAEKKRHIREQEYNDALEGLNKRLWRGEITQQQYDDMRRLRRTQLQTDINRITDQGDTQQAELLKKTLHAQREMVQQEYVQLYDRLKQSASGIFDALLDKNKSFLESLGDHLKTFFLTIVKEIMSTQIAKTLTQLLTGASVQTQAPGSNMRGWAGALGNVLGGLGVGGRPVFSNVQVPGFMPQSASTPTSTASNPVTQFMSWVRGGGATAAAGMATAGVAMAAAPAGQMGQYVIGPDGLPVRTASANPMMLPGAEQFLKKAPFQLKGGFGGKYGDMLNGLMTMFGLSMALGGLNQKGAGGVINRMGGAGMAAYGVAGQQLGGWGSAGVGLAYDGLVRGGVAGMFETAAGGAIIGAQFGGPVGAVIGGGIGLLVGGVRSLFGGKSPEDKLHDRVKSITGVDVKQKSILTDWLKRSGTSTPSMDLWIRSRDGQDAIQLYADSVGQKFQSKFNVPQFNIVGMGGSIYESQPYLNGTPTSQVSNLPSLSNIGLDSIQGGAAGAPTVINFTMPAEAVNDAFNGRTQTFIVNNPRTVQAAAGKALASSFGRTQTTITTLQPSAIRS